VQGTLRCNCVPGMIEMGDLVLEDFEVNATISEFEASVTFTFLDESLVSNGYRHIIN